MAPRDALPKLRRRRGRTSPLSTRSDEGPSDACLLQGMVVDCGVQWDAPLVQFAISAHFRCSVDAGGLDGARLGAFDLCRQNRADANRNALEIPKSSIAFSISKSWSGAHYRTEALPVLTLLALGTFCRRLPYWNLAYLPPRIRVARIVGAPSSVVCARSHRNGRATLLAGTTET